MLFELAVTSNYRCLSHSEITVSKISQVFPATLMLFQIGSIKKNKCVSGNGSENFR